MDLHYHKLVASLCCLKCHLLWLCRQKNPHQKAFYPKSLSLTSFCLGDVEELSFELKNRIERSWNAYMYRTVGLNLQYQDTCRENIQRKPGLNLGCAVLCTLAKDLNSKMPAFTRWVGQPIKYWRMTLIETSIQWGADKQCCSSFMLLKLVTNTVYRTIQALSAYSAIEVQSAHSTYLRKIRQNWQKHSTFYLKQWSTCTSLLKVHVLENTMHKITY